MPDDYRQGAATYYDRFSGADLHDVAFYQARLAERDAPSRVLELGCGTGRVLLPLAPHAQYIHGIDRSPAMLAIARQKLADAGLGPDRVTIAEADLTAADFTADQPPFDLIIAPFRVMQNLETDEQVDGMMRCIRRHLAPGGEAILNTFRPRGGPEALIAYWSSRDGTEPAWEQRDGDGVVRLYEDCTRHRADARVVYPTLTYRRYDAAGRMIEEAPMPIVMRVWWTDDLIGLIERHGMRVTRRWGGYRDEPWAEGPELVVAFTDDRR